MVDQCSSSATASFLRSAAKGQKPADTLSITQARSKYGFGGRLSRALAISLLATFTLNTITPSLQAAAPVQGESVAMHSLPAPNIPDVPSVVAPSNPDQAGPSRIWGADKDILIVGEQHTAAGQSEILLRDLPYLKARGMTTLAMEIPQEHVKALDKFAAGKLDKNGLTKSWWAMGYDALPKGFQLKIDMIEWAVANQVRVAAIDADRGLLYECASAQAQAVQQGVKGFIDPNGLPDVQSRGIMSRHTHMTGEQASQEGWRLWIHARSQAMAKNLAKEHGAHGGKTVALVGAIHTGVTGYREMMQSGGCDLRKTPNDGVEDMLPAELKAKTQTLLFVGGMDYKGPLEGLPSTGALHPVESALIKRGAGRQVVAIKSVEGFGGVDSVIFLPPVDKNPRVAMVAPDRQKQVAANTLEP